MSTPHNSAKKGDIAKTVLMPGDPLRAKFIAETYLEDPICYNTVRNMFGYTGLYKGVPVSVQGSGMGMPSMGIYSYELFHDYDVDRIIRVGKDCYYIRGDNRFGLEEVPKDWVLGMVTQIYRNGKYISVTDFEYRLYVFWLHLSYPFRRVYSSIKARLK